MLHTLQGKGGLNKRQVACTLDWQSITCKKPGGSSKSNLMMNLRTVRNISRDPGNNTKVRLSVCLSVSVCVCVSVSLCLYVSVFLPPYPCLSASLSLFVPPCDSHRIAILINFLPPFFLLSFLYTVHHRIQSLQEFLDPHIQERAGARKVVSRVQGSSPVPPRTARPAGQGMIRRHDHILWRTTTRHKWGTKGTGGTGGTESWKEISRRLGW